MIVLLNAPGTDSAVALKGVRIRRNCLPRFARCQIHLTVTRQKTSLFGVRFLTLCRCHALRRRTLSVLLATGASLVRLAVQSRTACSSRTQALKIQTLR